MGKEKALPKWVKFDADMDRMNDMIKLNFESIRITHPNCRLVRGAAWRPSPALRCGQSALPAAAAAA